MAYFSPSALAFLVKNAWHIETGVRLAADKPTVVVLYTMADKLKRKGPDI
jgi:hypothetical protein